MLIHELGCDCFVLNRYHFRPILALDEQMIGCDQHRQLLLEEFRTLQFENHPCVIGHIFELLATNPFRLQNLKLLPVRVSNLQLNLDFAGLNALVLSVDAIGALAALISTASNGPIR